MTRVMTLTAAVLAVMLMAISEVSAEPDDGPPEPPRAERPERGPRGPEDGPPRRGFRPPPNPFMTALDTDKDGEISAEELENAVAALKTLDGNSDGKLSHDEVRPKPGDRGPGGPFGGAGGFDGPRFGGRGPRGPRPDGPRPEGPRPEGRGPEDRGPEDSGPEDRDPQGPPPRGRRPFDPTVMIDHVMSRDEDGDSKLSEDEVPERMSRFFELVDTDDDGFVTREELTEIAEKHAHARERRGDRGGRDGHGPWMSHRSGRKSRGH
ncbi:MAG: hypothetical protein R3C02_27025, partial [Planctomycetaceae bacterium]